MRWLVALFLFVSFTLHAPIHGMAAAGNADAPSIALADLGDGQQDQSLPAAGCHACACAQMLDRAAPAGVATLVVWGNVLFSMTDVDPMSGIAPFPLKRPPRA